MSSLCLSFEEFKNAKENARTVTVEPLGITVGEIRYNHRRLKKYFGKQVRYFIDYSGTPMVPASAVCLTESGELICIANQKRPYNDQLRTFGRALDFDPKALRKLYRQPGWHGEPWHVHLASVRCSVAFEPFPEGLPAPRNSAVHPVN